MFADLESVKCCLSRITAYGARGTIFLIKCYFEGDFKITRLLSYENLSLKVLAN